MTEARAASAGIGDLQRRRFHVLALLLAIYTLASIDRQIVGLLQEPIKAEFGLADWQLGLMTGFAFALFYTTLSLPAARLVDRGASRTVLLSASLVLWSVMTALCGAAQSFWQLLAARAGVGVGEAGCSPPSLTLISDYFRAEGRGLAMGIFSLGIPLGSMLGLAIGGWAAQEYGWRAALVLVGLPGVLLAILFKVVVREPPRGMADGRPPAPLPVVPLRDVVRTMMRKPTFVHLTAGASLAAFCTIGVVAWFPAFFMRSFGASMGEIGLWWGLIAGASGLAGSFTGGWLCDRFGARSPRYILLVPAVALLISVPFSLLALTATSWPLSLALLSIPATLNFMWIAPTMALTQSLSPIAMRGLAGAMIAFFTNMVGPGLGPLILGGTSDLMTGVTGNDADGLRWALVLSSAVYVWAAAHFLVAARSVGRDLE